jgi:serine/threonine-protein kinase
MIVRGADSTGAFIHHVDLEVEREPIVLASGFNVRQPDVSADERWIAFVSDASGRGEVVVRSLAPDADGLVQVSREGGVRPKWARNGREIFYVEPSTNRLIVAEYVTEPTFEIRGREPLFQFPNLGDFDVASDDERFLIVRPVAPDSAAQVNPPRLVIVENWFTELRQRLAATP